jgi:hypothetical protein
MGTREAGRHYMITDQRVEPHMRTGEVGRDYM